MDDPRLHAFEMIANIRNSLNDLEVKLGEIPHEVETYTAPFVAPVEGDYLHPHTPTHECPDNYTEGSYWDSASQAWMMPSADEWDEDDVYANYHTNMNYVTNVATLTDGEWVHTVENDWSNEYTFPATEELPPTTLAE